MKKPTYNKHCYFGALDEDVILACILCDDFTSEVDENTIWCANSLYRQFSSV